MSHEELTWTVLPTPGSKKRFHEKETSEVKNPRISWRRGFQTGLRRGKDRVIQDKIG